MRHDGGLEARPTWYAEAIAPARQTAGTTAFTIRIMPRCATAIALALLAALPLPGCVRRKMLITSEPAGALVYRNDQEVGRTPLEVPFTWYGTYDIRLEKAGYQPLWTTAQAKAPWWDRPGPDLLAEAGPDRVVEIHWHFTMDPATPADQVDPDVLLDHARQMRALNQRD